MNSMADLFHPDVPFSFVYDTFSVMRDAADQCGHVFQVLTKRPGRAVGWWNEYQDRFRKGGLPMYGSAHRSKTRNTLPG